ncbi:HNH endonuclease [Devosia sp. 2618]|uniref:HNH endonuclease n=1 Tax=Devosia sp. 2618 TaxID=3156454 RepID=UPI00339756E1
MTKRKPLRTLRPRLSPMAPRLKTTLGNERLRLNDREKTQPWRRWYHSAEWKRLRMSVLVRDLFTCQMCGKLESNTSMLIGDHRVPHHGNRQMFFNEANIQCLCKPCHDSEKQRRERSDPTGWGFA